MVIVACVALFVGSVAQRVAGLGFAMMVAPFVVLTFGPASGVVITNLGGAFISVVTWAVLRRDVDWRAVARLVPTSIVGVWCGSLLVARLDEAVLKTVVGAAVLVAIVASLWVARTRFRLTGAGSQMAAGWTTGVLLSSAGVGGPTMSAYAVLSRWDQRSFAATLQPYFAVLSTLSVVFAVALSPAAWPPLDGWQWGVLAAAMIVGFEVGQLLAPRVSTRTSRWLVIALAILGAAVTCGSGVAAL